MPGSRFAFGNQSWYGLLIVIGMSIAIWLCGLESRRNSLPKDTAVDLALLTVPCGIIGARLYFVVFSWELYASQPIHALYFWEGGLAIYGGVIGGALAVFLYARRKKLPFPLLADCIAPGLALAQCIGRWGNFFNMEAYGLPVENTALQFFPLCVQIGDGWHMAAFFYESLWDGCTALTLWLTRKRHLRQGDGILWYVLLYGCGRLIIEGLRMDSLTGGGVRVSQLLAMTGCLAVCLMFTLRRSNAPGSGKRKYLLPLIAAGGGLGILILAAAPAFPAGTLLCGGYSLIMAAASLTAYTFMKGDRSHANDEGQEHRV